MFEKIIAMNLLLLGVLGTGKAVNVMANEIPAMQAAMSPKLKPMSEPAVNLAALNAWCIQGVELIDGESYPVEHCK